MRYVDVHGHVNFAAYDTDREKTIARAREQEVVMITVGTQIDTSREAVALAEKYDDIYAAVGLHPIHTSASHHDEQELGEGGKDFTSRGEVPDRQVYIDLANHPKVVAIGECGLDYYRLDTDSVEKQRQAFKIMIDIANTVQKPLMLHVRNGKGDGGTYRDALSMLKEYATVESNFHFFAGTIRDIKDILDIGASVSFTGVITFTSDYDELVKYAPLDRIMSETDCPFVAPAPYRGKRNEPAYVIEVVKAIARIRNDDEGAVAVRLMDNAKRFFDLA